MNSKFAESTLQALRKIITDLDNEGKTNVTPVVWVHDYQLLVAATHIRHVSALRCMEKSYLLEIIKHIFHIVEMRRREFTLQIGIFPSYSIPGLGLDEIVSLG